jgi:hypothetical protein
MIEMPSENDVLEIKKKRFRVLNTIYDLAEQSVQKYISTYEITNKIEILDEELYFILSFLKNQGLVKNRSRNFAFIREGIEVHISITHQGLCEVENVIERPNEQTENFPAHIYHNSYITIEGNNYGPNNIGGTVAESNIFDQSGNFGIGNMSDGTIQSGAKIAGVINEAQQQNLAETAAEIQQLIEQLEKSYPTDTTAGNQKVANELISRIDSNPTLTTRIFSALEAGSISAFEQLLNHPAASFFVNVLADWKKTKGS